jgi:hypothetical protein
MPDGTGLVSGGGDPTMKYWDLGPLETHQRGPQQAGESDLATRDSAAGIQPKVLQEYSGHTVCLIPGSRFCQLNLIHTTEQYHLHRDDACRTADSIQLERPDRPNMGHSQCKAAVRFGRS